MHSLKPIPFTNDRYLQAVRDHIVVFDGAMGTNIQMLEPTAADYGGEKLWGNNDYLVISQPSMIETIHADFLEAGAEVIETCTFRSNRLTMREYGLQDRILEINRAAASLARQTADRFADATGIPRCVAGSIGPTGYLPSASDPTLSNITFEELATVFGEQARGLVEGGVDLLLLETQQDILEVKAAVAGIYRYFRQAGVRVPVQVQVTLDVTGRMLLGTDIAAVLTILRYLPIDVIGLNCSTGPDYMREPIRYLTANTNLPISVIPNAGLPLNVDGKAVYPMEPRPLAGTLVEFVRDLGVNVVGGCCGTTPEHIRQIVELVRPLRQRAPGLQRIAAKAVFPALVASAMRATGLVQEPAPHLIGERINTQGSKIVKRLLLADDYDGLLQIARDQIEGGAHTLDVCVALTERADEPEMMRRTVRLLSQAVDAPLVIDSTEVDVLRVALENIPGRPIINSINLENGRKRCDAVLPLAVEHGAAVVALTIDPIGMAKTAARKLEVAQAIYEIAVNEYGLPPDALIYDALTFTLATGDPEFANSAVETLEGIRLIKRHLPGVFCSLGVSNLSFGLALPTRGPLNSVFLWHAVRAGLDMAIINPKHTLPYAEIPAALRTLCEDLIFNRQPDALARYIQYFEEHQDAIGERQAEVDPTEGMSVEEKLHWQIVHRQKEGVEDLVSTAIAARDPVWVLNHVLLPAMKEVGDKFGAGELILPYVLQSAEVMKKAVARLETYLERAEGVTKGKVVLATVYGDVHDIGKNLVNTILTNNGFTVFDLGKQVPANVVIDKAVEVNADAIGLSALLVSTSKQMPLIVQELHTRGLAFPVLVGGAAINRRFGRRILFVKDGEGTTTPYAPGVFYCKDAFEGLDTVGSLLSAQRADLVQRNREEGLTELQRPVETAAPSSRTRSDTPLLAQADIPAPPFWGVSTIRHIPPIQVFPFLDKDELYRLSWGAKNTHGAAWETLRSQFDARLAGMTAAAQKSGWLQPQAVYGYFPCQSDGNDLLIYDPAAMKSAANASNLPVIGRFTFPRQEDDAHLCIADYFAPAASGLLDVVALQVVTVGAGATQRFEELQAAGDYSEAYFMHGLAVQTAEATAAWLHDRIQKELGRGPRGKRYSWGYGACPDLNDHSVLFDLLPAAQELGMSLTTAFQLVPEQSTAALIVHHPAAKYYVIGGSRVEQLLR
ncbi:MAG: methionine synthase [Anaerolineae bacterium]|nr:methionine synthase [Anaerolineae bacterium]